MKSISEKISEYLQSEIDRGTFPSAQYLVGENGEIVAEDALGWAVVEPERIAASCDTIYDLASLTKPLVTGLLAVMLAERGLIDLDGSVSNYLVELGPYSDRKDTITLMQLLVHTSGLPAWRPLYQEATGRDDVPAAIARMLFDSQMSSQDVKQVVYSDLNYILLGYVIERVTGVRLDRLAEKEIFEPLGLERTMFNPPAELIREIAATERDAGNRPRWGEVHDRNAHFLGGVAGHAGLFSTSREVFCLANQFLPGGTLFGPESFKLFSENFTSEPDDARSVGWLLASTPDCSARPALPGAAFGHTGFTGTSLWIDPDKRRVFILLTNRVHPEAGTIDMKGPRRRFLCLAVEALEQKIA